MFCVLLIGHWITSNGGRVVCGLARATRKEMREGKGRKRDGKGFKFIGVFRGS
jgi:hypothetical protein